MPRGRAAISLVEIMLAVTVLSVMMLPLMGVFRLGNRFSVSGERELAATLFAHEVVERVRAETDRWARSASGTIGAPQVAVPAPQGFTYGVEVTEVEPFLDRFTVVVRWKELKVERKLTLSGLMSRTGARSVVPRRGASGSPREPAFPRLMGNG